jgi:hypothetical protein
MWWRWFRSLWKTRREERPAFGSGPPPAEGAALEDLVLERLGAHEPFDPTRNRLDAAAVADDALGPRIDEKRRDARRAGERLRGIPPRWFLILALLVLAGVEVGGCINVVYELGAALLAAVFLGTLLAAGLLGAVYVVGRVAAQRRHWLWLPLIVLLLLLLSVAALRVNEIDTGEGASAWTEWAVLGLSIATVAGIPVAFEEVLRVLRDRGPAFDERKEARREATDLETRQRDGRAYITRRTQEDTRWNEAAAQLRAALRARYPNRFRPEDRG